MVVVVGVGSLVAAGWYAVVDLELDPPDSLFMDFAFLASLSLLLRGGLLITGKDGLGWVDLGYVFLHQMRIIIVFTTTPLT